MPMSRFVCTEVFCGGRFLGVYQGPPTVAPRRQMLPFCLGAPERGAYSVRYGHPAFSIVRPTTTRFARDHLIMPTLVVGGLRGEQHSRRDDPWLEARSQLMPELGSPPPARCWPLPRSSSAGRSSPRDGRTDGFV